MFSITCGTRIRFTRDDTHDHPGAYFQRRAKTNVGDAANHSPHPRAFPVVALFRESVTFLQPTNRTFIDIFLR